MALRLVLNGTERELEGLAAPAALEAVVSALGLKADRVAIEWNGAIAPRGEWAGAMVVDGDKVEIVHFVGGGSC